MFHTATLTAHRGATLVTRDALAQYEPPEPEGRWKPVKHSLIVDFMHEELARRNIEVHKEEYAIQRDGNYLFAALTTNWLDTGETAAAIAFRPSNDKTEAMKMYAGVHVFICDNMALSGDEIILNRKHTTRLNVAAELTKAFDRYRDGTLLLQHNIDDLSERYWPAFSRLDEAGQRAFWDVLGVQEEQGTEDTHAVCDDRSAPRRH